MISVLADVLLITENWLAVGIAVFLRIGAAFLVLPGLGDAMIPARIRLGAALALSAVVTPMVHADYPEINGFNQMLAVLFFTEAVSGLLLGIGLRLLIHALQIAGSIAANATSLAQLSAGAGGEPQPAIGQILMLAGITLAIMGGLHVHLAQSFARSYDVLPLGRFPVAGDLGRWGIARVGSAFALGFSLAAPFLIASLLYNLTLGAINKAMPQLMVALVGAPAITLGSLVLLFICAPFMLSVWHESFLQAISRPMGIFP